MTVRSSKSSHSALCDYIGFADLTSFIPLIVHTVTLYRCLLSSLCINLSTEPLTIQLAPLYLGATSAAAQLAMMQKTATHYTAIQERIGPNHPKSLDPNLETLDMVTTSKELLEKDCVQIVLLGWWTRGHWCRPLGIELKPGVPAMGLLPSCKLHSRHLLYQSVVL